MTTIRYASPNPNPNRNPSPNPNPNPNPTPNQRLVCDERDCKTHLNRGCLVVQLQERYFLLCNVLLWRHVLWRHLLWRHVHCSSGPSHCNRVRIQRLTPHLPRTLHYLTVAGALPLPFGDAAVRDLCRHAARGRPLMAASHIRIVPERNFRAWGSWWFGELWSLMVKEAARASPYTPVKCYDDRYFRREPEVNEQQQLRIVLSRDVRRERDSCLYAVGDEFVYF